MATLKSQSELQTDFNNEVQSNSDITDFLEGSITDIVGGVVTSGLRELELLITDLFNKTYFDSANGPEVTGGPDDLQTLAVDHFGQAFARLGAQPAVGVVTFSRPTTGAGNVSILTGTIVKTQVDPSGNVQRFATIAPVTLTGLSINASVRAVVGGTAGNADIGQVNQIESALTDPTVVVTNAAKFSGGAAAQDDATYRDFIRNLIETIKGAIIAAIEAKAKTVSGVVTATILEAEEVVIKYDIATDTHIQPYFRIPVVTLYIADANGSANDALVANVKIAITFVRACGVVIGVVGATPFTLGANAEITLNPSGPNFGVFQSDTTLIKAAMTDYIAALGIGVAFQPSQMNAAILAIYGPAGTNDLLEFTTTSPSGVVQPAANVKFIPGTMTIGPC